MAEAVWPELSRRLPDARLTIVGASPPQPILDLAARDTRVTATGFVDDVRPYMERAQVYLCPMRDGGGTRLKILDALAMGVPIVATQMALEGIDVVAEQDVLVANEPAEFVRQIERVVNDRALWTALHATVDRLSSATSPGRSSAAKWKRRSGGSADTRHGHV